MPPPFASQTADPNSSTQSGCGLQHLYCNIASTARMPGERRYLGGPGAILLPSAAAEPCGLLAAHRRWVRGTRRDAQQSYKRQPGGVPWRH